METSLSSSRTTIAVNALVSLIGILVGLAILELAVRLFNLAPLSEASFGGGLKAILEFDPVLETRYIPRSETRIVSPYGEFDVTYHINSLGLRDSEVAKKPADEFRVLVAGNSFVEGWGVKDEDEFVRVAEGGMNQQRGEEAKHVRLVNAGIAAYGAAQSYLQVKKIWNEVDPDMVILVVVGTMVNSDFKFLKLARHDADGIAQGLSAEALLSGGAHWLRNCGPLGLSCPNWRNLAPSPVLSGNAWPIGEPWIASMWGSGLRHACGISLRRRRSPANV